MIFILYIFQFYQFVSLKNCVMKKLILKELARIPILVRINLFVIWINKYVMIYISLMSMISLQAAQER